jgi:hypothetical protein
MTVSPHVRAALLLLVALVLVLTGARLATSTAAPAAGDSAEKAGTLIDFGRKDGKAVLPWSSGELAKAPSSFRKFVRGELRRIWRDELGHTPGCKTSPVITVDALRTDGFALGDVATRPRRDCETGGGYIAIWAVRKGAWKQVIGTQEVVECRRLERWDIPAEIGIDQCYQGGEVVPYTHP